MKIFKKVTIGTKNREDRDNWIKKTLGKIPAGKKILDAGAGELRYKEFCSHLDYVSQDFCQYDGKGNGKGLYGGSWDTTKIDIVSDISEIPVKNNSFDAVMCIEVFEHIPEPVKAIQEFNRILKSKGRLIITAPFCSLTHMAPYYFGNGYSKYWYEKVLGENGFVINEINYNGNYFKYLAQEIRRIPAVEKKYTDLAVSQSNLYRITMKIFLRFLNKLSKSSKDSEELLCFGLYILATKK